MQINPAALKDMREARGLSKTDLQKLTGISLSYLSELESGHKPGSPKAIRVLASSLRCSMATLAADPNLPSDVTNLVGVSTGNNAHSVPWREVREPSAHVDEPNRDSPKREAS